MNMTGAPALLWREAVLLGDEAEVKKEFEEELQHAMPPGVQVKMNHFVSLTDYTRPLMAVVDVSGTLGTQTGEHLFMPAVFFEAGNGSLFSETHRENPVDLHYPFTVQDKVDLTLPPNITVDSLPQAATLLFNPNGDYVTRFVAKDNVFDYKRRLRVATSAYKADEYSALRNFYQKVSADDQEQVALKIAPVAVSPADGK